MRDYPAIAEAYYKGVIDGSLVVCRMVRLAVERQMRDREREKNDPNWPYYWDPEAGTRICLFFSTLQPSKWPTKLELQPWQIASLFILYSWKRKSDGYRRFRQAYWRLPRKTGKSAMASGCGLYALAADGERGAEVYSAALTRDQARRVFDEAVAMRDGTAKLRQRIQKAGRSPALNLHITKSNSVMKPLSRDTDSLEGLNSNFTAADEVHKWNGRDMWDVLRYSMRSRTQPLMFATTTAPSADDNTSICNSLDNYTEKILTQVFEDETFFGWITEIDEDDAWDDETKWIKANPNLGVTVKLEDMQQEAREARNQPDSLQAFKRYSLNIRIGAVDAAIKLEKWDACARKKGENPVALRAESLKSLAGRPCFGGLDLAIIDDTSALALIFPPLFEGEKWRLVIDYWVPEENIKSRAERDRVPYDMWKEQGFLYATPGETTDFNWIADRILEVSKIYDLRELAYDPALATELVKLLLTSGLKKDTVVKFAQTAMNYAAPCGGFSRTILRQEIEHDADPVLRWQISNLRWAKNHTGLIMPDKLKSIERIDGAVASIMAYGRATHPDNAILVKPKPKLSGVLD